MSRRAQNRDEPLTPVRAEDPYATDFRRKYPHEVQSALEKKLFRGVGRAGEACFVWHGLGSGNANPLIAYFACENFSAVISLWDATRIIFAGGFQSVAVTSRIVRACLATVARLCFSHRSSVRRGLGCDSAFRSLAKLFRAWPVTRACGVAIQVRLHGRTIRWAVWLVSAFRRSRQAATRRN
jgi:hypothetical protein